MSDWISVKETLPFDNIEVLVVTNLHSQYLCIYHKNDRCSHMDFIIKCECEGGMTMSTPEEYGELITHWMPLPKPPEIKNE